MEIALLPETSQAAASGLTLSSDSAGQAGIGVTEISDTSMVTWPEMLFGIWAIGFLIVMTGPRGTRPAHYDDRALPADSVEPVARPGIHFFVHSARTAASGRARERRRNAAADVGASSGRESSCRPARRCGPLPGSSLVLPHELAHVARRDCCRSRSDRLRRLLVQPADLDDAGACATSEQACDDAVLRRGVNPADVPTKKAVARQVLAGGHRWASAPAIVNSSSLERRIAAMLNTSCRRESLTLAAVMLTLLAVFAVATPVVAATLTEPVQSMMAAPGISRDVALVAPASVSRQSPRVASARLRRAVPRAAAPIAAAAPPAAQAPASLSGAPATPVGGVARRAGDGHNTAGASTGSDGCGRPLAGNIPPARVRRQPDYPGSGRLPRPWT